MSLICLHDYEREASAKLPKNALEYYRGGAGDELTLKNNVEAFSRLRIRPRFLRDISGTTSKCSILGNEYTMPVGIAPSAMQKMAHPEGEIGAAKAAAKAGCVYILSTLSTTSLEDVAQAAPETHKWFQLYIFKDRRITESLIRRAEKAGYEALVVTIDAPVRGTRRSDIKHNFEVPPHLKLENLCGELCNGVRCQPGVAGVNHFLISKFDTSLTWTDIDWLREYTKLPIILKGILTPEDALLAYEHNVHGIIVSNHGARQVDTAPATIEVLPEITRAVGDKMLVMMDGGIRTGNDIFKALAFGAKMVFVGRSILWGLTVGGQKGVEDVLEIIHTELELLMGLCGSAGVGTIKREMVVHESYYWRFYE